MSDIQHLPHSLNKRYLLNTLQVTSIKSNHLLTQSLKSNHLQQHLAFNIFCQDIGTAKQHL